MMNFSVVNPATNAVIAYAPTLEAALGLAYGGDEALDVVELLAAEVDAYDYDDADPFAPPF